MLGVCPALAKLGHTWPHLATCPIPVLLLFSALYVIFVILGSLYVL